MCKRESVSECKRTNSGALICMILLAHLLVAMLCVCEYVREREWVFVSVCVEERVRAREQILERSSVLVDPLRVMLCVCKCLCVCECVCA